MSPDESSTILPGLTEFLRHLGINSQDSDFLQLQEQVRQAILNRQDFTRQSPPHWEDAIIEQHIPRGSHVLDLGCGNGELLVRLVQKCNARVQGIETDEEAVIRSIERGIPVYHEDLENALPNLSDEAYDFAVLENTLQTLRRPLDTLQAMLRVARTSIVSFPNFAHWPVRLAFSLGGRMPMTSALPHNWHDTPNIHLCSISDFLDWTNQAGIRILDAYVLVKGNVLPFDPASHLHNIIAEQALFFFCKN